LARGYRRGFGLENFCSKSAIRPHGDPSPRDIIFHQGKHREFLNGLISKTFLAIVHRHEFEFHPFREENRGNDPERDIGTGIIVFFIIMSLHRQSQSDKQVLCKG
jgi:hypothetical protein